MSKAPFKVTSTATEIARGADGRFFNPTLPPPAQVVARAAAQGIPVSSVVAQAWVSDHVVPRGMPQAAEQFPTPTDVRINDANRKPFKV